MFVHWYSGLPKSWRLCICCSFSRQSKEAIRHFRMIIIQKARTGPPLLHSIICNGTIVGTKSVEDREDLLIFSTHDTRTNGLVGSGEVEKSLV
jgi:hypothetical protein